MNRRSSCLWLLLLLGGCDRQQYDYVVGYQEYAYVTLDEGGQRVFLKARATFVDTRPGSAALEAGATGPDDRYLYVLAHPEVFGPIGSRAEYEEQFGESGGASPAGPSSVEIVISANNEAEFTVAAGSAVLTRDASAWPALSVKPARLAVGWLVGTQGLHEEGGPVTLEFPALPEVAPVRESLSQRQIRQRPTPPADPIELEVTLEDGGRARTVVFVFNRSAVHPNLPPNPLYWLYAAH